MGKLLVIEGLDASGKGTHTKRLIERFEAMGVRVKRVTFPDYEQPSSELVKMYLGGQFGSKPGDVNAYAASSFYAVDRFASYNRFWKNDYDSGTLILCDRYTTSNIPYQMPKLPHEEWDSFLEWLYDYEFAKLGLPRPDAVLFLNVPPATAQDKLMERYKGDESKKDIHEKDLGYQTDCYEAMRYAAEKLGWLTVDLTEDGQMRSIEENQELVFESVKKSGILDV